MAEVIIKSYKTERLKEITDSLEKKMEKVGAIVERQAKINVSKSPPSHPQVQTNRLRSSIMHRVEMDRNEIAVLIGTDVDYAPILEFGNSRQPPYPWLFPAVEMKRNEIVETLKGKEFTID